MYNMVERYMKKISINDVNNFALKKNIHLSTDELTFTYDFIKKNWDRIISNPNMLNLSRYKDKYSNENYKKIEGLFNEYYSKYHRFL